MQVCHYNPLTNSQGKRLYQVVTSVASEAKTTTYRTIDELCHGLRQPMNGYRVAVILADTCEELSKIHGLLDWFWNCRIILILPDHKRETVSNGWKLFPRFISYIDSDFNDVGAVLEKMLAYKNTNNY